MKSYEEMAREILADRDAILARRRKRRSMAEKCAACAFGVCAVVLVSVNIFSKPELMKPYDNDNVSTATAAAATDIVHPTSTASDAAENTVTSRVTVTVTSEAASRSAQSYTFAVTAAISHGTKAQTIPQTERHTASKTKIQTVKTQTKTTATMTKTAQTTAVPVTVPETTTEEQHCSPGLSPTATEPAGKPVEPPTTTDDGGYDPNGEDGGGMPNAWEYQPFDKRFTLAYVDDTEYCSFGFCVSVKPEYILDKTGFARLVGNDFTNGEMHFSDGAVFAVDGYSTEEVIAVSDGSRYYAYYRRDLSMSRINELTNELKEMTMR